MYAVSNIIIALTTVINSILTVYSFVIIGAVIISWVQAPAYNPIVRIINQLTLPLFKIIQKRIPTYFGGLDFTPIIVLLLITFIQVGIVPTVMHWANTLAH